MGDRANIANTVHFVKCRHCPCESKTKEYPPHCEYCDYCKYCTYCRLCDYCEEGSILSTISESISLMSDAVLDVFKGKDRKLAEKAKNDLPADIEKDERLSKDKLAEIDSKYKDKLKEEDKPKEEI